MAQVSSRLRRMTNGYEHWCPGCGEMHAIYVREERPHWTFDGNFEAPTFNPSVKITGKQSINDAKGEWTGEWARDADGNLIDYCCHYFLHAGELNFLGDCTHALKGQKVPLPELPEHLRDG